ncbi:hypothetical protein DFQ30_003339 [Apophysomyces sp. BC1015]|nr:hypothetical protein DFQ30_003339 [Apophysomyces sp. BC1015]
MAISSGLLFMHVRFSYVDVVGRDLSFFLVKKNCMRWQKQLKQLNINQKRQGYNADGAIRLKDKNNLKILLLETSNTLEKADCANVGFDHHKAMFGALAMLKSITDTLPLALSVLDQRINQRIHETEVYLERKEVPVPDDATRTVERLYNVSKVYGKWLEESIQR